MSFNDKYAQLRKNPPKLVVPKKVKEVMIHVISHMCDNEYLFTMKKNREGEFKLDTVGYAYSNFGIKYDKYVIEWAADKNEWNAVFSMINSGYQRVERINCR